MSRAVRREQLNHSLGRTLAALLGSLPVALAIGIALGTVLPLRTEQRYLIGSYSVFPTWVALACWLLLATSAGRAWGALALVSSLAALLSLLGLWLR
jgi:hypothetical protein